MPLLALLLLLACRADKPAHGETTDADTGTPAADDTSTPLDTSTPPAPPAPPTSTFCAAGGVTRRDGLQLTSCTAPASLAGAAAASGPLRWSPGPIHQLVP